MIHQETDRFTKINKDFDRITETKIEQKMISKVSNDFKEFPRIFRNFDSDSFKAVLEHA